jgi:hypothetical protein
MAIPQRIGLGTVAALALLTICGIVSRSFQVIISRFSAYHGVTLPFLFAAVQPWSFSLPILIVAYRITVAALPHLRRSFG